MFDSIAGRLSENDLLTDLPLLTIFLMEVATCVCLTIELLLLLFYILLVKGIVHKKVVLCSPGGTYGLTNQTRSELYSWNRLNNMVVMLRGNTRNRSRK